MKTRLSKTLVLGQDSKEDVLENKGGKLSIDSCIWCDKPVWISEFGYTEAHPKSDISVLKVGKEIKALHKMCLIEILDFGQHVARAIARNLKSRGETE